MSNAALHVARTGLDAQNTKMRVIANNLANVNTTGFKRDRADFETLAYQQMIAAGANSDSENKFATGLNLGSGVSLQGTSKINTQGTLTQTGNSLDMAIEGSGFFQVQRPDGSIAYTRAGNFSVTAEGTVVTSDGLPLIPQVTVPEGATSVTVGNDGTVSATLQGEATPTQLGQIELATFMNAAGLSAIGGNLLVESAASGTPQVGVAGLEGRGSIRSGSLETSNVNVVEELVDMIETQRAYEVNSKMIKATDEMLQYVNQNM
ncbi:flagellar basal-body rod protein FlgG [Sphingobium terrigena]|uniref:Flagellar basal-body rod protein FlgG n=1 Tax=Sphingobium terrigena TaxID=2304063 RepID=A0A418YJB1_9SPHN|nr:flagellar basal-body rod protein FlgG [Sphingobium terrigena]RJG51071.1 flagellar basal-body rod protein FlgG [Sphingobium terrigena]